jgi:MoaA/NifB/PqqE/SkfB family radical SAM enzyme
MSTLFLEVTGRCNERCVHCYAEASPEITAALDRETCERVIADAARLDFERLQLTGGDPLLCSFLPQLAAQARRAGIPNIEVYTNGLALTPDRLFALAESQVSFAFSFYSFDAALHDARTRVPGSHGRTADAIRRAVLQGCPVRVGVIAIGVDPGHIERTFSFLESLGVARDSMSSDRVRTVGRGSELSPPTNRPGGQGGTHGVPSLAGHSVRWPGKLCVSYTGAVYPCIFSRTQRLGDVRAESLMAVVERIKARVTQPRPASDIARLSQQLACFDCRLTALSLGGAS